jgi:hypothetical protein
VVLDILRKWGHSDFDPGPKEVLHFDVISPLLHELRKLLGNVTLVKIKSHSGCLMNERANEQAELSRTAEGPASCPGPQKYGSFWLRVRPAVREIANSSGKTLPRDSAPKRSLLEKTASFNTLSALWASARSPLWRRRGPGSGSASGGPGGTVQGARPGRGPGW